MTKDEQIKFLIDAIESIRDDFAPWYGENAIDMKDFANETLVEFKYAVPELK